MGGLCCVDCWSSVLFGELEKREKEKRNLLMQTVTTPVSPDTNAFTVFETQMKEVTVQNNTVSNNVNSVRTKNLTLEEQYHHCKH